jgi:hypothetical protein
LSLGGDTNLLCNGQGRALANDNDGTLGKFACTKDLGQRGTRRCVEFALEGVIKVLKVLLSNKRVWLIAL